MFSNAKLLGKMLPSTLEGFISLLFWHSIFFTASTPIMRILTKKWLYVLSAPALFGAEDAVMETYPPTEQLDRAWIPHALFGMAWLCAGSAQFLITPTMKGKAHKFFGYFAIVIFCGHLSAAFYALYTDALKHTFLNKMFLINDLTEGATYMTMGMLAVFQRKKGWLQQHKDQMFLAFVTSIEGAGTIRTISFIHYLMEKAGMQDSIFWGMSGAGISQCQREHRTVSSECEWEYTFRMVAIRFLTNLYVHQYATFTPSCVEIANKRWKAWVTMLTILGMAADQEIPPHYAFGAVLISSAYNHGYLTKISNKTIEILMSLAFSLARKVVERSGHVIVELDVAKQVAEAASKSLAEPVGLVGEASEEFDHDEVENLTPAGIEVATAGQDAEVAKSVAFNEEVTFIEDEHLNELDFLNNRSRSSRLNPAPEGQTPAAGSQFPATPFAAPVPTDELRGLGFLHTPKLRPGGLVRTKSITITTTIECPSDFELGSLRRDISTCSVPACNVPMTPKLCEMRRSASTTCTRPLRPTPRWVRSKAAEYTPFSTFSMTPGAPGVSPLDLGTPMAEHRRELFELIEGQKAFITAA